LNELLERLGEAARASRAIGPLLPGDLTQGITGEQSTPNLRGPLDASPVHPLVRLRATLELFILKIRV
jgi:hypothetical protein